MRVIDRSEFRDENDKISLENRVRGTLRFGLPWYGIMGAQEAVTETLNRSLSNDYHLLRNVFVPGTGLIASLILIGPQGVYAMLASPVSGVFRAKDEEWLSHSGGHFRPARPNLQQSALAMAQVLLEYFHGMGYGLPQVEAALIFTSPQAHVDTVHPRARIVLADGVEHFAANMRDQPPIMDREDAQLLMDGLLHRPEAPSTVEPEPTPVAPRPAAGPAPEAVGPFGLDQRKVPRHLRPRRRRARLGRSQRLLLGTMVMVEVCILAAFAALIFLPTLLS
jgi:hypothetical protein